MPDAESRPRPVHPALPPLELGQELDAVVIEELADGRLVFDIRRGMRWWKSMISGRLRTGRDCDGNLIFSSFGAKYC